MASLSYRFLPAPRPDDTGRCPPGPTGGDRSAPPDALDLDAPTERVRFTYRDAHSGALICDALVAPTGAPVLGVPDAAAGAAAAAADDADVDADVDIDVEFFGADDQLLAVGHARSVDLRASLDVDITVYPADAFSCARERAEGARAFHTATRLPNRQVLILGGVVGAAPGPDGPAPGDDDDSGERMIDLSRAGARLAGTAELYDPASATFTPLSVPGLIPRALHQTFVLDPGEPSDPDAVVTLAVVGGVTVAGDAAKLAGLELGQGGLTLTPSASAAPAPTEIVRYDPVAGTLTRVADDEIRPALAAIAAVPAAADDPDGAVASLLSVGGWDGVSGLDPAQPDLLPTDDVTLSDPRDASAAPALRATTPRIGATATPLSDGRVLIWGGQLAAEDGSREGLSGELFDGLADASPRALPAILSGAAARPRTRHAAARAGDGSVLVVGGFDISAIGVAQSRSQIFTQRLSVSPGSTTVSVQNLDAGGTSLRPAAFAAATAMTGGDVLISGGNPESAADQPCSPAQRGLVCSQAQSYRYRAAQGDLAEAAPLLRARYGHRQTEIEPGQVLVTGGLSATDDQLAVISDAELYVTSPFVPTGEDGERDPFGRLPGQIATAPDGQPSAPCALLQAE